MAYQKEQMFWKLVDEMDWGNKDTKKDVIRKNLKNNYDAKYVKSMHDFAVKKRKELCVVMDDFAVEKTGHIGTYWGVGDDGFWDLSAHIVGLGEKMYNFIYENPIYAKSIKYRENFEYCFYIEKHKYIADTPEEVVDTEVVADTPTPEAASDSVTIVNRVTGETTKVSK